MITLSLIFHLSDFSFQEYVLGIGLETLKDGVRSTVNSRCALCHVIPLAKVPYVCPSEQASGGT